MKLRLAADALTYIVQIFPPYQDVPTVCIQEVPTRPPKDTDRIPGTGVITGDHWGRMGYGLSLGPEAEGAMEFGDLTLVELDMVGWSPM
jgi:hypothetical protein